MKKTLVITLEFPPQIGGIVTYVHDLASALDPEKTIVLAPTYVGAAGWDKERPYKIIRKRLFFPGFIWPRWIKLFFIVRRIVKLEGIEVIMIHHVLPVGYIGVLMKKLKKTPFLLFSHGTDLIAGTATPWKKKMVMRVSNHAEQIIFNSKSLQTRWLRVLPEFEKKCLVLYPCPQPDFLTPPPDALLEELREKYALRGKKVMLSISRLDEGKGFPHLIRILPEVLKQVPNLVWFIVGDGPKRQYVMELVQKNNLQNIVRYVGQIPHADWKPYYYLADLFVLLTHPDEGKEEGLGLVFLEAAAAGIPTVAGRSGGVEEAVIDGQTGVVVDLYKGDKNVAVAIAKLLQNSDEAEKLGVTAQERIVQEFQWVEEIKKLGSWLN
jgi:phosphatidylinositol alpha-1,6-mannosyltransferase